MGAILHRAVKADQYTSRRERLRQRFAAELEELGHPKLATRARECCRKFSVRALDCCGARPSLQVSACGIRGCPICSGAGAKRETESLWSYAQHLEHELGERGAWRHVVLTANTPDDGGAIDRIRGQVRDFKRHTRTFWKRLQSWKHPPLGLRVYLELGEGANLHVHCLMLMNPRAKWIDNKSGWLGRVWGRISGWGTVDERHGGELRAVTHVEELYYYASPEARRACRKTRGASKKALREFGKYVCAPKAPPELAARLAVAMRHQPRSWSYGAFAGLKKKREAGELRARDGAPIKPHESAPEHCPECGTVHPRWKLLPWTDRELGRRVFEYQQPTRGAPSCKELREELARRFGLTSVADAARRTSTTGGTPRTGCRSAGSFTSAVLGVQSRSPRTSAGSIGASS